MAYNIKTTQSTFSYPKVNLIDPADGINYFDSNWKHVSTFNFAETLETGSTLTSIIDESTAKLARTAMYHITGTITRDITDNALLYVIANTYSVEHCSVIIPADQYQTTNNVDVIFLMFKDLSHDNNYFKLFIKTIDKQNKVASIPCDVDLTIDYYCL